MAPETIMDAPATSAMLFIDVPDRTRSLVKVGVPLPPLRTVAVE